MRFDRPKGMTRFKHHRQIDLLWKRQDGLCHWCGCKMVRLEPMPKRKFFPDNACTLDHLEDRFNPRRGRKRGRRHVLACRACNQERGRESERQAGLKELRRRSRFHTKPQQQSTEG